MPGQEYRDMMQGENGSALGGNDLPARVPAAPDACRPVAEGPAAQAAYSRLAVWSLVLACLTVFIGPFGFVPAIVCGHLARAEIRRTPALTGEGMATAGLIIAYVCLGLTVLLLGLLLFFAGLLLALVKFMNLLADPAFFQLASLLP